MSYFSLTRSTDYSFRTNDPNTILAFERVKDITQRFKLIEYIRSSKLRGSEYYFIQDGERPDIVSYKLYGNADLHWLLFLFNDILNPLFEWPSSYMDIQRTVEEKYKGSSIFLNLFGLNSFDDSDETSEDCRKGAIRPDGSFRESRNLFEYEEYRISSNDEVILEYNGGAQVKGKVINFDIQTGELRVLFDGNLQLTDSDSNRIYPEEYSKITLKTKNFLNRDTSVSLKEYIFVMFKKTRFVLDHFENENGQFFSPLFYYNDVVDSENSFETFSEFDDKVFIQGIPPLNQICFSDTLLGRYLIEENERFVISRERQEFIQNETRRKIEFPDPTYVPDMIKEIRKILSE